MPIKLKKTVSTSAVTGNSVQFDGSNQYLSVPSNANFGFGASDYTIEFWTYYPPISNTNGKMVIDSRPTATNGDYWNFGTFNTGIMAFSPSIGGTTITDTVARTNQWVHYAVSRSGSSLKLFANGTQVASTTDSSTTLASGLLIGANAFRGTATDTYWLGYISNIRILKGTALYTSNFTPSTSPLIAIANTSLLTCKSATIVDNSTNNFTITNNNTATVSSAVVPFTTSFSVFKLKKNNANPVAPYSVLFNGTNQCLSVANNAAFDLGAGNFTLEGWVYSASSKDYGILVGRWGGYAVNGNSSYAIRQGAAASQKYQFGFTTNGSTDILIDALNTFSLNTWYHLAAVRNGTTFTFYVNGVSQGTATNSSAVFAGTTNLTVGGANNTTDLMNGYASNVRIVKGTALYTASFTVPTTPLTAITNTSLLTCNAATIVDSSTNNFTITNNNTATVSSTITPFTASISTNKFKLRQVSYSSAVIATQKAIFGYGNAGATVSMTNLVSNTGVVATDTTGVGTVRRELAAAGYGSDKAIFGYGDNGPALSMTNLVSNNGVVSTDTTGVGTARAYLAAAGYGTDKALFGYGYMGAGTSIANLVSNTGVVATDTAGVGTARWALAAAGYGNDKAIFGYGYVSGNPGVSMANLVSNTGVVATDTTGVGTARYVVAAAGYGVDKAIFGYGHNGGNLSMTNLVSNAGVVATDTTGVGTSRYGLAAAGYGSDKAIFGYGYTNSVVSMTNLVSNTGVVVTDTVGVGTVRYMLAAAGYSLT